MGQKKPARKTFKALILKYIFSFSPDKNLLYILYTH